MRLGKQLTHTAYGFGQLAEGIKNSSFELFVFFYYNQVLGLSGTLAGLATFLALFVDAVSDPLVGSLSDNTRHRWGRRHPYLYAAAVPLAVLFALLFRPPAGLGQWGLFFWLLTFAVLVRFAMTLYHVPHMALGVELSDDYRERTTIVAYRTFFGVGGAALASVLGLGLYFRATPAFPNGQLDPAAYPQFADAAAVAMVVAILLSALGTHHRIPTLKQVAEEAEPFSLRRVWREVREVLASPSFRALFIGVVVFFVMRGVQSTLGLHMGTYFWQLSTQEILGLNLALLAGFISGLPVWTVLGHRLDKKPMLLIGITIFSVFVLLPPMLWMTGLFPEREHAGYLATLLAMFFAAAFGGTAALIAAGSMMADVTDEHELAVGRRQEGVFFGAMAFAGKSASGVGHQIAGIGVDAIGFPAQAVPGEVPQTVLYGLGLLYGPGIMLLAVISVVFLMGYRLDRARHAEIVAALEARRSGSGLAAGPAAH